MGAITLIDTNVLLRLMQPQHTQYSMAAAALAKLGRETADLCIAPQNLVEVWVVATRPASVNGLGMSPLAIVSQLRTIKGIFRILEGKTGVADAWEKLMVKYLVSGKVAHDAHLVATMQVHGVTDILTFNVIDFRRFSGITVLDPATF